MLVGGIVCVVVISAHVEKFHGGGFASSLLESSLTYDDFERSRRLLDLVFRREVDVSDDITKAIDRIIQ